MPGVSSGWGYFFFEGTFPLLEVGFFPCKWWGKPRPPALAVVGEFFFEAIFFFSLKLHFFFFAFLFDSIFLAGIIVGRLGPARKARIRAGGNNHAGG